MREKLWFGSMYENSVRNNLIRVEQHAVCFSFGKHSVINFLNNFRKIVEPQLRTNGENSVGIAITHPPLYDSLPLKS